jgi:serine/threonine-protein kinase HSL1 (negative regulator of Swe1 kinase)
MPDESPTRHKGRQRTQSGFSVGNSEHLLSIHSFYEITPSEASYDPFRASREPVNPNSNYANVTVCHAGSAGSGKIPRSIAPTPSIRTSSLRVNAWHNCSRRSSKRKSILSSSYSLRGSSGQLVSVSRRRLSRSSSRMSISSSQRLNAPPVASMRPSDLHRRAVHFSHLRRSSTASALTAQKDSSGLPKSPEYPTRYRNSISSSPPVMPSHNIVRSRKENLSTVLPTPITRKIRDVENEARKASTALEMVCDEAFFRSSISSSGRTSLIEKGDQFDPVPMRNTAVEGQKGATFDRAALVNRPLPPTPVETRATLQTTETPNTYTARELAEMRERLATKYARDGASNQKHFVDVLLQLETLMTTGQRGHATGSGKRVLSAPQHGSSFIVAEDNYLHVIPEEGRYADPNVEPTSRRNRNDKALHGKRAATEPLKTHPIWANGRLKTEQTIRLVQPSSSPPSPALPAPTPWAPLVIRKQSNTSSLSEKDKKKSSLEQLGMFNLSSSVCVLSCPSHLTLARKRTYNCFHCVC